MILSPEKSPDAAADIADEIVGAKKSSKDLGEFGLKSCNICCGSSKFNLYNEKLSYIHDVYFNSSFMQYFCCAVVWIALGRSYYR